VRCASRHRSQTRARPGSHSRSRVQGRADPPRAFTASRSGSRPNAAGGSNSPARSEDRPRRRPSLTGSTLEERARYV
jgi:hypothetical protein